MCLNRHLVEDFCLFRIDYDYKDGDDSNDDVAMLFFVKSYSSEAVLAFAKLNIHTKLTFMYG